MLIFINGSIVSAGDAKVSVLDRGFLYGDGVFETLRAYKGTIFQCDSHIDRLFRSAEAIYLKIPFTKDYIKEGLYKCLKANYLQDAYLRISITRGRGKIGLDIEEGIRPTLVVLSKAFTGYPEDLYRRGIPASVVTTRRIPPSALNPEIKSLNFLNNILARAEAAHYGAMEGIMLNIEGYVAEGTVSNIFIVKDGIIKTPPPHVGILNGVTRSTIIGLARGHGLPCREEAFSPEELYRADECFITSTMYEVMPVTSINNKKIGNGKPGEVTIRLLNLFRDLISRIIPATNLKV